jgi:hypothetical protein
MAQQASPIIDSAAELLVESLRLTAFLAPSVEIGEPTWWEDLVGSKPETRTSKPNRGELQVAGPIGERTLVLSAQPGRVDWLLTPRFEQGASPETRWAGRFLDTLGIFDDLMNRWLTNCPALVRLAFGAAVHEPVRDRVAGYLRLARYLPAVQLDPEGSEDFFYQINRPRTSRVVQGLRINRLSKWVVARFVPIRLTLTKQSIQQQLDPGEETCRIELDISTDAQQGTELPRDRVINLFQELKEMALELARQGDVP